MSGRGCIRLSKGFAVQASKTAAVHGRSLAQQVEAWARLGRAVEATVLSATIERLAAVRHDTRLARLLATADTVAGRRKAARLIAKTTAR